MIRMIGFSPKVLSRVNRRVCMKKVINVKKARKISKDHDMAFGTLYGKKSDICMICGFILIVGSKFAFVACQ